MDRGSFKSLSLINIPAFLLHHTKAFRIREYYMADVTGTRNQIHHVWRSLGGYKAIETQAAAIRMFSTPENRT